MQQAPLGEACFSKKLNALKVPQRDMCFPRKLSVKGTINRYVFSEEEMQKALSGDMFPGSFCDEHTLETLVII